MSKFMRFSANVQNVFNNDVNDFMAFSELLTDVARGAHSYPLPKGGGSTFLEIKK